MSRGHDLSYVLCGCLCVLIACLATHQASARPLVSDLAQHVIAIDSRFRGTDILLFGARNAPGDIIVVVRGPDNNVTIRKKERVAGLWVNRSTVQMENIPSYYYIASTRPLSELKEHFALMNALEIGLQSTVPMTMESDPFRDAWMEDRLLSGLYQQSSHPLLFMGETLFKTVIPFPESIPRGHYTAEVYLIDDGQLVGAQSTPLEVYKQGVDAVIYDFAQQYSGLYGVFAVCIALIAGWLAGIIFRKA